MPVFVDTNVLVYARDTTEPTKHDRAREWLEHLWRSGEGRLSVQVLQEFYVTATRKLSPGMSQDDARADVRNLNAWRPVKIDERALEEAWALQDRFALSFWDALIVAAARIIGCEQILSEDLQTGQELDGLRVVNPFEHAP